MQFFVVLEQMFNKYKIIKQKLKMLYLRLSDFLISTVIFQKLAEFYQLQSSSNGSGLH